MFGLAFLKLFAVLFDDLDSSDEEEEERRKKFEYAYDKFCIYNAGNKMSHHNIAANGFEITGEKLDLFKARVSEFYFNLAKGQECIVRIYDEENETLMLVLHGSYRRSVPAWDGPEITTLF
jgi:hypothetical protein